MRVNDLAIFIVNRDLLRERKEQGMSSDMWTDDPILKRYRFCNVERENDRVTQWIAEHVRKPEGDNPDLWFAMALCRWINWPETIKIMLPLLPWDMDRFVRVLRSRKTSDMKSFGGAYMITTHGHPKEKPLYIAENVLEPAWRDREYIRPRASDSLRSFSQRLQEYQGFRGFMAGQVIADVKYDPTSPLRHATDWWTWAVSGPGSSRGLNRVFGRDVKMGWKEPEWHKSLNMLSARLHERLPQLGFKRRLHAQDIQNCLCEFDKYERTRLNEGVPRSVYRVPTGL